jgi:long-chain fatty acid transport protein
MSHRHLVVTGAALAAALVSTLVPSAAYAGGFYVPEIGPRGVAMGGAMVAEDVDPSAVFHNPAGLVGLAGTSEVQLAGAAFLPDLSYFRRPLLDPSTGEMVSFDRVGNRNKMAFVPYVGASFATPWPGLELGFAVYAPFGATIEYPVDGAQRQVVTGISLRTIYASPAIAYALPHGFRVGLTLSYIYSDLTLDQANALPYVTGDPEEYPDPDPALEGQSHIQGKDTASFGATLGAQWRDPDGRLTVGVSVMTPTDLEMTGDAVVTIAQIGELTDADGNVVQGAGSRRDTVKMDIPLPLVARAGVSWKATPRTHVSLDVNFQRWSTFEKLVVDFQDEVSLLPSPGANLYDVTVENRWRDTWSARLGAESRPWKQPLALRAGVLVDQSPIDDRHFGLLTPDSDKLGVSGGLAWSFALGGGRRLDVDLSYLHLFLRERNVEPAADGSPGSDGTVLNKPAPSFYQGVTRAAFDVLYVAATVRL